MFSPFVIGSVERAQALQEDFDRRRRQGQPPGNRSTALVEISIDFAGRGHAAFGRRPEAAAYLLDFLPGQITSAFSSQHSVLIIHGVSPFIIGSVERARDRQKKSSQQERLLVRAAALAVEGISVKSAGCSQCACGQRPEPTGYHRDFMFIQITSALAN